MAKKIVGIYKITCKKNGKFYIGQSTDIKRRFSQHRRKPPARMQEDFDLYGVDEFIFEILEECAPEELDKKETAYMNELQSEYNIKTEGHGIFDEAREKLRELNTGKKRPDISRKVKCVETGEVFDSIKAAAQWCNVPSSTIVMLLKGKGRTAGGYHWIYADDGNEEAALERIRQMPEGHKPTAETLERQRQTKLGRKLTSEHSEKIRQSHLGKGWKPSTYEKCCRKIRCVETGVVYASVREAAEAFGVTVSAIGNVASGRREKSCGYHWEFFDGQIPPPHEEENPTVSPKLIRCVETRKIFKTIKDAAEHVGISTAAIRHTLHGWANTAGGCHWEFCTA